MNKKTLNQIVLIHPVKFVCSSIKEFAALEGVDVYFMEAKEEFTYLINDLKPEVLLVHHSIMQTDAVFVLSELEKAEFKDSKLIIIGNFDQAKVYNAHIIEEPFSLESIISNISKNL